MTPLHYACCGGHADMARLLLSNKADINAKDSVRMKWCRSIIRINLCCLLSILDGNMLMIFTT